MSAASYIGRVGGLAVALGVGTAIVTGQGVAYATPASDDGGTNVSSEGNSDGGGATNNTATNTATNTTPTTTTPDKRGPGKIDIKLPRLADIVGRHRADATTPGSVTATSIVKRFSDATKRVTDALEDIAAGGLNNVSVQSTSRTEKSSNSQERVAARSARTTKTTEAPTVTETTLTETNNPVGKTSANRLESARNWLASPQAAAGRAVETINPVPQPTKLWTPPRILAPFGTMQAAPDTAPTTSTSSLLTAVLDVVSPFAGNSPASPGVGSPLSWVLAGAARREIGIESFTPQALLAPSTNSLTYDPTVTLVKGVITGDNNGPTEGVNYFVVSQPSGGGKVYVDPQTGDFSFLPDLSSVQSGGTETFSVVVAETTPFTSAITGIPVVGSLASQVFVVLYQIPVVNVVLSPIIGRSQITSVPITVSQYVKEGQPVAFTVMVESFDGTLISTNYFPATRVASGDADVAPTILNGPGLATAGNIDPTAPNTVDGLVPGIDALRDAGYNVVTWDPRGEFASTGRLELDSPEFEGQDVKAIISWITDNPQYTRPAMETANDPWIGMVGGSYGGGIQLVTAAIDDRVDVIVPGIAWNKLNDSLYPHEAFKTAYSSLLLLGLVTAGARINPQIYGGIITGAVLGILTPGQQQLLARSGPWDLVGGIDIPTLFIQGTVDVLFPLQQALTNAETIGPNAEVSMIWFCGGHGFCLTLTPEQLAEQNELLLNNTIAWLNNTLPEADGNPYDEVDVPKFQFVDQNGTWYTADVLPIDSAFYAGGTPIVTNGSGGLLPIVPLLGGSGPQSAVSLPYSLGLGSQATNAINVPLNDPTTSGVQVVGAPQLTMTYSGIGTSRHVYAQIVDKKTGLVVGNIVTPLPVTLDGRTHTQTYQMEDIVWTYGDTVPDASDLELQIVSSATPFLNFTQYGFINVSSVSVSLPTPGPNVVEELADPSQQTVTVAA
ncbi:peptidase S15 [Mycolicibacterium agri]|uniref:Peptidase S15 n=1 Tax=Mycolicibacterium agri TaxID=36811 RepID=A0A2A7NEY7_MYCAG|nr:alpha/beta hydrolase [Mycolicibacterium agri]PEG42277.1 peptidase S15 [Mycolicibacterium agri]GFG51124.1 hypothetical protein MAGR_25650 [Mycolicibacterium agri]